MARPFSTLTRQLLTLLEASGRSAQTSTRYWGKIGLAHMIQDASQALQISIEREQVRRSLQRLRDRGWVAGENNRIELTPDGQMVAQHINLRELKLRRPAEWDGIWRMVIWDIPEVRRPVRDVIRRTLARLGFVRIQRSVWVTPLPCQEELSALRDELAINQGLLYIEARRIEGERLLRHHFKLS